MARRRFDADRKRTRCRTICNRTRAVGRAPSTNSGDPLCQSGQIDLVRGTGSSAGRPCAHPSRGDGRHGSTPCVWPHGPVTACCIRDATRRACSSFRASRAAERGTRQRVFHFHPRAAARLRVSTIDPLPFLRRGLRSASLLPTRRRIEYSARGSRVPGKRKAALNWRKRGQKGNSRGMTGNYAGQIVMKRYT